METYATKIKKNLGHQPVTQEPNHTNNEFTPKKNPSFKKSFHHHHHHNFSSKQNYKAKTFQTTKPTQEEKSSFKNNYNRLNVYIASSNVNSFEINKNETQEKQEKQSISLKKSLSAHESETITFKPTWMIKSQSSFVQINKTAPLISDSKENKTKNQIKQELKINNTNKKLELEESSLISINISLTINIKNCFVSSEYLLSKTKLIEASKYALAYRVDFMQNYTAYLRLVSLIQKLYWTHRNYSNKKCFNSTALLYKKRIAKTQTEPMLGFKLAAKCLISRFDRLSVPKHHFKFSFELVELIYAKTQQFELYINPYSSIQFAKIVLFNQFYLNTDNESTTRDVFFSLFAYQCSFDEFSSLISRTTNESCASSLNSLENYDTETESEEPFNLSSSSSDIYEARNVDSKRPRPSYIIERDCHVFGGCMDDDAEDEFFISSGAVYQSWPYVYEPGFQMTPLVELTQLHLSKSAANLNYFDYNEPNYAGFNEHEDELPSYSLDKFGINFMHTEIKRPKAKKKQRKAVAKWNSNDETLYSSSFASYLSTSFSNEEDSGTDEESSDDSESIIEYKRRHAAGLNCLNAASSYFSRKTTRRCSYLSLSVDEQQSSTQNERFGKNVCSSSENVAKGDSVRFYNRLACSYYDNNSQMNNLKRVRFLSQKRVGYDYDDDDEYCRYERHYMSSNNLVF